MKRNKLISLGFLMAVVMIMSVFSATVSVCATVNVAKEYADNANYNAEYPIEACYVEYNNPDKFVDSTTFVLDSHSANHRLGFMKFDFSSVDLNSYNGMQLKLAGVKTNNVANAGKSIDIKISIIPDELEDSVNVSDLTYNSAKNAGWLNEYISIGNVYDTMTDSNDPKFSSTDILGAIKSDIVSNDDNIIVLKIENNAKVSDYVSQYYANWPNGGYYKEIAHVVPMTGTAVTTGRTNAQADADAIIIPDTVESDSTIVLPSTGTVNTSKITWESSSEYIDVESGTVASIKGFADEIVTLTASVVNNYIVVKKEFQVTVKASMVQQVDDYVTIKAHGTGFANSNSNQTTHLIVNPQYSNNRHQGVLRFDLTSIKETINALDDISMRLTFAFIKQTSDADLTTGKYELKILPHMDWSVSTMTYDYIYKYGATDENPNGTDMFRNAVFASKSGTVPTEVGYTMIFTGLKSKIAEYIANNPDATTITFLLAGENLDYSKIEDSVRFYVPNGQEDPSTDATAPVLIGETSKRFVAQKDNGTVTFTYNADSAKYPNGINMAATFFAAEYAPDGSLVSVVSASDADSVISNGETKTLTITGYTSGNTVKAMVFNNSSEIMAMQPVTIFGN